MHRIVKAHLESFVNSYELHADSEADQFEKFVNFSVITSRISSSFDLDDVTTGEGDDGLDGIAVIIDEEVVVSKEDAQKVFSSARRNHDVDIIFVQAKRSESFDLGDFLKFKESILRFVNEDVYNVNDRIQNSAREVFDVVMSNVPKVRDGKPSLYARYVTTGTYQSPKAFEDAHSSFKQILDELGLFEVSDIRFIGRDELTALWVGTYSGISTQLEMFSSAALPTIDGIEEAYLAVVRAKDYVDKLLLSSDGNLMTQVFEENVRSFLGIDNPVNMSISKTLKSGSSATRFPVLNNGITIVSPNVRIQSTTLHLENYQIVNGCQTSNMLFENYEKLDDKIMVTLKVVETSSEDVFSELVRATNSQSKVEEVQFLSLRPIVKKIEQYFGTYEGSDSRLFLERRDRQYVGKDIPATRIFSVHIAARCVAAMFCMRPDLSFKFPKAIYDELSGEIFAEDNKEDIFYAACITLYRLHLLVSNSTIPQNMRRFKWHILPLIREQLCGSEIPNFNSKKSEQFSGTIIRAMAQRTEQTVKVFETAVAAIQSLGEISDDRLKRRAILEELLEIVRKTKAV